jgi:hypothetical protein
VIRLKGKISKIKRKKMENKYNFNQAPTALGDSIGNADEIVPFAPDQQPVPGNNSIPGGPERVAVAPAAEAPAEAPVTEPTAEEETTEASVEAIESEPFVLPEQE